MEEDLKILENYIYGKKETMKERLCPAIENLINRVKELEYKNKQLKEYIVVAPNLDEMTAIKYKSIQENAYIRGRAEEQQRAKEIIHNDYIPKSKINEKIEELDKEEQELQNSISDEEREEYSDASISWELCDIETRRRCYKELLEE